jgi:RNA polymerase sigma-70 factor (ECF subfamily)
MDPLTALLLAAQRGDRHALERFVIETQHDVVAVCRYLGDTDNADDLAQETYARAFAALHRFRATGPARHWLLKIARRTCADAARRRIRQRALWRKIELDQGAPAQAVELSRSGAVELDQLVLALDADRRAAFVMTQMLGLRYEEAAELLDVPIGTIRSRVARAREQLLDSIVASETDRELPTPRKRPVD